MNKVFCIGSLMFGLGMVAAISYGLALVGHPVSVWLWHDVFPVLPNG